MQFVPDHEDSRVLITCLGRTVHGTMELVSSDGLSAVLFLDAGLAEYDKFMPVLWGDGHYVELLQGRRVLVQRLAE